jgi:hypothetical protein
MACLTIHPFELVKEMIALPIAKPVTKPELDTVATAEFEETHAFNEAAVVVAESVIESPIPNEVSPEMTGVGFTVIFIVSVIASEQFTLETTTL